MDPVIHTHRRTGPVTPGLLAGLVTVALAGCGTQTAVDGAAATAPPPSATSPAATSPAPSPLPPLPGTAAPPAERPPGTDGAVALPWPVSPGAETDAAQAAVDRGAQPWLLDPSEVALSYAQAAHGWTEAEAFPHDAPGTVDVRDRGGERITLTLVQPGRTGPGGIWVVTADRPS